MRKIVVIVLAFWGFVDVTLSQTTFESVRLTKPFDQFRFEVSGENRYWFMSKTLGSENKAFALYSPDDGQWFTSWTAGSGDMLMHRGNLQLLSGNIKLNGGRFVGFTNVEGNLFRIGFKRLGLKTLDGGSTLPWDDGLTIESDGLIVFNETDNDIVRGWMDVNNNIFHWSGKIGIGISSPSSTLHVGANSNEGIYIGKRDKLAWDGTGEQPGYHIRFSGYRDIAGEVTGARISALRANICCSGLHQAMELAFYVNNGIAQSSSGDVNLREAMRISKNGNVGIGTTTPDAKLDVAGNIKAQEIEVTLAAMQDLQLNGTLAANNITYTTNGQTADHVFEADYHLRELSEVEAFITENKHLPEIPSAAAMEEQGVNLAEMNKLLLQKVEELTLYMLQQQKEIDELKEFKNNITENLTNN